MTPEQKRINAEVRVLEIWRALETIERQRSHIEKLMRNHDPAIGDHATRRDCTRFHEYIRELGLGEWIKMEVTRTQHPSTGNKR